MRFVSSLWVLSLALVVNASDGQAWGTEIWASTTAAEGYEVVELVRGAALNGANGMYFGPDGNLYVAVFARGEIVGLNPQDGEIVARFGRDHGVLTPDDLTFGPDGSMYWTDILVGEVGRLAPDGTLTKQFVAPDDPPPLSPWTDGTIQVVATDFGVPAAAKFDPSGQLHVVDQTGEVFRVDVPTGAKTLIATLDPGLDNLAFDDGGNLFVSNADFGWVAQIEASGPARYLTRGGRILPQGVAVLPGPDGGDRVFVADLFRLREFDGRSGQELAVHKAYLVPVPGKLTPLFTLSADGDHLVVSSLFGAAVQVWDPLTEDVLEHYAMPAPGNAIRFQGDLVVPDLALGGVVWASDGGMVLPMDGVNVFVTSGLATDGERLWIGDWATGIVWQLEFDGRSVVSTVPVASGLAQPEGVALDVDGSLLVVETGKRQLSRVDLATGPCIVVPVSGLTAT